ncbi:MAG: SDR family oxidoreductase [Defluviitaleaceae bacterium]|nr:SDR family oxidoreductase [Defluviitaleaceae bacterium]
MVNVEGRWTLVTGASRGIGREIALYMAKQGANLVVHSRDLAHTKNLVDEIKGYNVDCFAVACELSDEKATRQMADDILKRVEIDILFNNAGVQAPSQESFYGIDCEAFVWTYKVNTLAPMILIEKFLPHMLNQKFGRIINSTSGIKDQPEQAAYAASKGAIDKITKDLSAKLVGTGVLINIADPGWIKTELGGPYASHDVSTVIPGIVIGAFAEEEDINGAWIPVQRFRGMSLDEAVAMSPALVK